MAKRKTTALTKAKDRLRHQIRYYEKKGFAIDATAKELLNTPADSAGAKTSLVSKIKSYMKQTLAVLGQNPILKSKSGDFIEMTKQEARKLLSLQRRKKIDPFTNFNKQIVNDIGFSNWLREREMFTSKEYKNLQRERLAYNVITAVNQFREPLRSRLLNKLRKMKPEDIEKKLKEIYARKTRTNNTRYDDLINVVFSYYKSVDGDDLSISYDVHEKEIANDWGVTLESDIKRKTSINTVRQKIFGDINLKAKENKFVKKWKPSRREKLNGI